MGEEVLPLFLQLTNNYLNTSDSHQVYGNLMNPCTRGRARKKKYLIFEGFTFIRWVILLIFI